MAKMLSAVPLVALMVLTACERPADEADAPPRLDTLSTVVQGQPWGSDIVIGGSDGG